MMKYYGSVIPHDWDVSFENFGGLLTVVAFWDNKLARKEQINFSKYDPQWVKCHTPMDVKLHLALCVKSSGNRMEPFPIGKI